MQDKYVITYTFIVNRIITNHTICSGKFHTIEIIIFPTMVHGEPIDKPVKFENSNKLVFSGGDFLCFPDKNHPVNNIYLFSPVMKIIVAIQIALGNIFLSFNFETILFIYLFHQIHIHIIHSLVNIESLG